jgi:hypothetical protein
MSGIEKIEPWKHLFELIYPKSPTLDEVQPAENNGGLSSKKSKSLKYA